MQQKILLVEDNDDDAELTIMAFARARVGNPVVRVCDGVEAIEYLLGTGAFATRDITDIPAVVLLDLNLPRVDGISVLKKIRESEPIRYLPVVILTSSDEEKDRLAAYHHFANSFVRKPVNQDQFMEATRSLGLYWLVLNRPLPR